MRKKLSVLVSVWLLASALNIDAQRSTAVNRTGRDRAPARMQQPARMSLDSDSTLESQLAPAATTAVVNVDATKAIRPVDPKFPGINAAIWDSSFESRTTVTLLDSMRARLLRFPGGSLSDEYHWKTNTNLNNTFQWATSFDDFASIATAVRSEAIITVNYGTGTADEAAAWVEYSNMT